MKQSHLIGFTAVLVALVSRPERRRPRRSPKIASRNWSARPQRRAEQTSGTVAAVQVPGEGPAVQLTLDDAVKFALERNLDIAVQRLNPQLQDIAVASARTVLQPDADVEPRARTRNVERADQPAAVVAGRRRRHESDVHLQRRHHAELALGGGTLAATLNNSRQATNSNNAFYNPQFNSDLERSTTRSRCCATSGSTRSAASCIVSQVNRDISDVQLRAAMTNTRLERPERLLGLRVRDAGGRGGAPVARARRASSCRTTRRASRSARWRRSTSSRRRPSRRRGARAWSPPRTPGARPSSRSSG